MSLPNKRTQATYEKWLQDREHWLKAVKAIYEERALERRPPVDGIFAIPKGGLFLGVWLANKLGLPLLLAPTENSIIVDDIIDSGSTINRYFQGWRTHKPTIMVWYINEERKQDLKGKNVKWLRTKKATTWIDFFWET